MLMPKQSDQKLFRGQPLQDNNAFLKTNCRQPLIQTKHTNFLSNTLFSKPKPSANLDLRYYKPPMYCDGPKSHPSALKRTTLKLNSLIRCFACLKNKEPAKARWNIFVENMKLRNHCRYFCSSLRHEWAVNQSRHCSWIRISLKISADAIFRDNSGTLDWNNKSSEL